MEDIIPFLIVMAISIIGAATRKKKKRSFGENISAPREEVREDNDFMSWMERVAGVDEEPADPYQAPIPIVEPVAVDPVVEEPKPARDDDKYKQYSGFITPEEKQNLMKEEGQRVISKKEQEVHRKKDPIKEFEIGREKRKIDFDLKRAVIYSELLNRKYS